jgi:hypothetical protein
LNIAIDTNNKNVAGFFAKDIETGLIYLMHTGKIGGGRPGIGKDAFLMWSKLKQVRVFEKDGDHRLGLVIGAIEENEIVERVSSFVKKVSEFKKRTAELDTPNFQLQLKEFGRYNRDFSGRKKGYKGGVSDYTSYHGDIVDALYKIREADKRADETVLNNPLIDLCVKREGQIVEVYEVKTSSERQALYTALGQLIVHSGGDKAVQKIMVLPKEEMLPEDIAAAVEAVNIKIWEFTLHEDRSCTFSASSHSEETPATGRA